ncbi:MAG: spore photoproduct lyase family protein [candidate division KSB1 bacterium]
MLQLNAMPTAIDYAAKFASFQPQTLFEKLPREQRDFIRQLAFAHRFTSQEFREVVNVCRDLSMWGETGLQDWWQAQAAQTHLHGAQLKKHLLHQLQAHLATRQNTAPAYSAEPLVRLKQREKQQIVTEKSDKKIYGMCPVASEKTVCCNLRTIDAVENCIFGCSYCSIQTFYREQIIFDADFAEKLRAIPIAPERFYHFGTGQASDALAWGNRNGNLEALCRFAKEHPSVLLELKTKSDNIGYFLERPMPKNLVCSWSLNTPAIIANEEHFTASLEQRLAAARAVADRGLKVAFHFHPLVQYQNGREDYRTLANTLLARFQPEEVLFISFGSVTLIKPVIQKMRELGHPTKITQAQLVADPHGKLTYTDEIKIDLFKTMHEAFAPWRERVFMYLCMEKAAIWEKTFGYAYRSNEEFEEDFGRQTMRKIF